MCKAVYFFCADGNIDPVAPKVFNHLKNNNNLPETALEIDGFSVLEYHQNDDYFQFARLNDVLSHNYTKYLPVLNEHFGGFDVAGVVNWHEGANAPDKILTAHSTGDVASGYFGKSNPKYFKNIICSLEQNRVKNQLNDFRVMTEATHWSGIPHNQSPELITEYDVPVYDIEIGSTQESWSNEAAIKTLSESLFQVFDNGGDVKTLLCAGGIHFEEAYLNVMLDRDNKIAVGHILANQWIVSNYAGEDGLEKLSRCGKSIIGGICGIIFHDNLKGEYKDLCREMAKRNGIFVEKHKVLKNPNTLTDHLPANMAV
jgi:D-tyrosyl-tRNA(Tyr) deacylase